MSDGAHVKRGTAKRKSAMVVDIFKGKITPFELAWQYQVAVAEIGRWVEDAGRNMENGFRT